MHRRLIAVVFASFASVTPLAAQQAVIYVDPLRFRSNLSGAARRGSSRLGPEAGALS